MSKIIMKNFNKKAFTLVELIVVITILSILATIAFVSFQNYTVYARDVVRVTDLKNIYSTLEHTRVQAWGYTYPDNPDEITFSGSTLWQQWTFGDNSRRATRWMDNIPTDPLTKNEYTYSVTQGQQEFELGAILESWEISYNSNFELLQKSYAAWEWSLAYIIWSYNGKILKTKVGQDDYILAVPSIINSEAWSGSLVDILTNKTLSYKWYSNIPSSYWIANTASPEEVNFVNQDEFIVFMWSASELSTDQSKRTELIANIQKAYLWTKLENSSGISSILEIDTTTVNNELNDYSNTFVENVANVKVDEDSIVLLSWDEWSLPDDLTEIFDSWWNLSKNWNQHTCESIDIEIVELLPWVDTIPENLNQNTVYKLSSWNYISSTPIMFDNCTAIIAPDWANFFSSTSISWWFIRADSNKNNIIIHGINIDNTSDWTGWFHSENTAWIAIQSLWNSTIDTTDIYNWTVWIELSYGKYNTISHSNIYNNENTWVNINWSYNFNQVWFNILENVSVYGNWGTWIRIWASNDNTLKNLHTINNEINWILLSDSLRNTLTNINSYNNLSVWVYIYSNSNENIINNVQALGNKNANIALTSNLSHNSLNNISSFSSDYSGVLIHSNVQDNIIHNANIFSSKYDWISIPFSTSNNILSDIYIHSHNQQSNNQYGLNIWTSSWWKFYNDLKIFANKSGNVLWTDFNDSSFSAGDDSLLWFWNWVTDYSIESNVEDFSVTPSLLWWDSSLNWRQCVIWWSNCSNRTLTENYTKDITFTYWTSVPNQKRPIQWNSEINQYEYYGIDWVDYYTSKKIGEW